MTKEEMLERFSIPFPRKAVVQMPTGDRKADGTYAYEPRPCWVHGFFQYQDESESYPAAVCELPDGVMGAVWVGNVTLVMEWPEQEAAKEVPAQGELDFEEEKTGLYT